MLKFKDFILGETYVNLFSPEEEDKYVDEVWGLLQTSYKSIGGIKGSGFASKEEMERKNFMWKLNKKDGKILAGIIYKNKHNTRKGVAVFTNSTNAGKAALKKMLADDFSRSLMEVSHSLMKFIEKNLPSLVKKYAITSVDAQKILGKEIEIIDKYHYNRSINGTIITKRMIGSKNKPYLKS